MKKKITLLVLAFVCVTCLFALTACGELSPLEEVEKLGNTIAIYYDDMVDTEIRWYQVKPNSPIPNPGVTPNFDAPEKLGYIFEGYYLGEKDEDGNVTYGQKWDFDTKVTESVTLYAKWSKQYVIHINYVLDGQIVQGQDSQMDIPNNVASMTTNIKEPTYAGNTFVEMYTDAQMTKVLNVSPQTPFVHGCTQENPVVEVYAKFIQGAGWKIVRSANDMATVSAGSKLYLLNDIDFASRDNKDGYTSVTLARTFSGVIEGNGHTIKNLNYFAKGGTDISKADVDNFGLFAKLQNATIKNVTFENCSVVGQINRERPEYFYAFLAGTASGCTFENITLKNCQVKAMTFGVFTDEKIAELQGKIDQKLFVSVGSDFEPVVTND